MVNWFRQITEELLAGPRCRWRRRRRCAWRPTSAAALLEPIGIAAGEDDLGTLCPGASSRLEPDPRAAADEDDGLSASVPRRPRTRWRYRQSVATCEGCDNCAFTVRVSSSARISGSPANSPSSACAATTAGSTLLVGGDERPPCRCP